MNCPKHIEKNAKAIQYNVGFLDYECDGYHFLFQVKCNCGCKKFEVLTNPEPRVIVKCVKCRESITVYNLRYYPAASLIPFDEEEKLYISSENDEVFKVFVIYEYSDDEFDQNDITACEAYGVGVKSKKVFCILEDETAQRENYEFTDDDKVILINEKTMAWEDVKCNGITWITIDLIDKKGDERRIIDIELA